MAQNQIPVDGGHVTIVSVVVTGTRRKVNTAADFFVKQNIADCVLDVRVDADCEFADVACALVGVENRVCRRRIVCGRFNNFAVFENKPDVFETEAVFDTRRVVVYHSVDAVLHGGGINFAVGDIHSARTSNRGNIFYAER